MDLKKLKKDRKLGLRGNSLILDQLAKDGWSAQRIFDHAIELLTKNMDLTIKKDKK